MHKFESYRHERKNPSFSSTLLDEIYRSVCEGDTKHEDLKFYRDTMPKKQSKGPNFKGSREEEEVRRACLIEKWAQTTRENLKGFNRKPLQDYDLDQDPLFFSSTSISSDSSSGGFSSSDTESFYGAKAKSSSLALPKPKPVRTSVSARSEKTETTAFYERRELHRFGGTEQAEESIIKSKSRALKIYNNLKKVKQPISPGGKLANFLNSLFTNGNSKKSKNSSSSSCSFGNGDEERKIKSAQASSTCSSASSFSRSCLSKSSEKFRNGSKRTVRFYPVSVIVDEDSRPCGHKSLYEEEQSSSLMSVSLPTAWKIGKSPSKKIEDELKFQVTEKGRRVEEGARELFKEYHHNQKKHNDQIIQFSDQLEDAEEEEDDDDAASYSSSDLFELDHLRVIGNDRYCQELPVYETTRVDTNRAITNGLIM